MGTALRAALVAALGTLVLGVAVRDSRRTWPDAVVDQVAYGLAGGNDLLEGMPDVVRPIYVLALALGLGLTCAAAGAWRSGSVLAAGPVLASWLTEFLLQPGFSRPAPAGAGEAYPSGHATAALALLVAVWLVLREGTPLAARVPLAARRAAITATALLAAYVVVALVSVRYHYVTDVAGAAGVAVAAVTAVALVASLPLPTQVARLYLRARAPARHGDRWRAPSAPGGRRR